MPKVCEHNIPETKKGAGPCDIRSEVRKRNGKPNWWCHTHGLDASAPDGAELERCPGAWFDRVPDAEQLEVDLIDGEYSLWGALPPAIEIGQCEADPGKVHVHHRLPGDVDKVIDRSFSIVRVRHKGRALTVEGMAAVAYSISELAGVRVSVLTCPRCGDRHIDELRFATNPHRKHLCNSCGRNFRDTQGPSVGNPLANAYDELGIERPPAPIRARRPVDLRRRDWRGIAMWPSNSAILSTARRPEEEGIHVHAWGANGDIGIDDTFSAVRLDGELVDEGALRVLAIQRALAHGAPIVAMSCCQCGEDLVGRDGGWVEPRTSHTCRACGKVNRTRRKVFVNPLAEERAAPKD